ncbi:MAG: hypothetical protein VB858_18920 [Planctomycetaceae bacterium]
MDHYSTGIASTLARAAADSDRPRVDTGTIGLLWQADEAEVIEDDDSTALLIADRAVLIVAHLSTQLTSPGDWRSDFDLRIGHTCCGKLKLSGHAGFQRAMQAVWLWLRVKKLNPATVYVTGHSLGAPQAVLTALALTRRGFPVRGCDTSGSPRCFTHGSARIVNPYLRESVSAESFPRHERQYHRAASAAADQVQALRQASGSVREGTASAGMVLPADGSCARVLRLHPDGRWQDGGFTLPVTLR